MSTTLHSFMDIFETTIEDGDTSVQLNKIVIPLIQRDYAQGRIDKDINRVRSRFLQALYRAVTGEPITLDFVYGDIDEEGTMTPLDGQQRLTTLFLLHWYAAKKEKISDDKYAFLSRFSYETRYSARYFCAELVKFMPSFETTLSADIKNQAWFPFDWKDDPTISSMLVMLDAIDERFKDVPDIWEQLENKAITFYFLPIRDMGLTDELYIKMNSRGKPLTVFEHFKAELEREIRALDEKNGQNTADRIVGKIDKSWTDLLWKYRSSGSSDADDNIIDDEFLRYFKFVCDIICYRNGQSPQGYSSDIFDLLHFASKSLQYAWDELFHKSANAGFENTHTILVELLKSKESFDDGILDGIISAFLAQCEKDNLYPWNYYYVKYPVFRPGSYGKMSNDDVVNKPYMFSVMQTKTQWSQNTYMPYLKEADDDHLSRDEMGQYLVYDDVYIVCENNSYGVYRNDDDSLTDTVTISQNEAGIDTEDRIIKLKKYIANMK